MAAVIAAFLGALVVGLVGTWGVRSAAQAWKLYDVADSSRKVHTRPIPRLGGVAIVGAFFLSVLGVLLCSPGVQARFDGQLPFVLTLGGGAAGVAAVGLYDDLRGASPRLKLLVQVAAALLLWWGGMRVEVLSTPFGPDVALGVLALPFTVLWLVGVINALNLIDGLDGLAGGAALLAVVTHFILALVQGDVLLCVLLAAVGGAVLAFLAFNAHPASIFMGDTGSMFLGLLLAVVTVRTSSRGHTSVAMLVPVVTLGLPILDTLVAMSRRALMGRPIFGADREHIHHRLMSRRGLSHPQAVHSLYGLCLLFSVAALGLHFSRGSQGVLMTASTLAVCLALLHRLGYLSLQEVGVLKDVRRRNLRLRAAVRAVANDVRAARSLPELSASMRPLVHALHAQQLLLEVHAGELGRAPLCFSIEGTAGDSHPLEARRQLKRGDEPLGNLVLVWRDSRRVVDRDEELAIEQAATAIAEALSRLMAGMRRASRKAPAAAVPLLQSQDSGEARASGQERP